MREAMFYKRIGAHIQCELCPHKCLISIGQTGRCRVRQNIDGQLYALGYGKIVSAAVDPIEKKPLYHFFPGKDILSIGFSGCNMTCQFCQNYTISQSLHAVKEIPPEMLLSKIDFGLAFTYNEPFINYEYMYDLSTALKKRYIDKKIVVVTNGMVMTEPLKKILPFVDAFNLDVKGSKAFYESCGGNREQVIKNIKVMNQKHLEITILMVTGQVSLEDIKEISSIIAAINPNIPLHLSRYYPNYHYSEPPTDMKLLLAARQIANELLNHVYLGNVDIHQQTTCATCGTVLIDRQGYNLNIHTLDCGCKNLIRS